MNSVSESENESSQADTQSNDALRGLAVESYIADSGLREASLAQLPEGARLEEIGARLNRVAMKLSEDGASPLVCKLVRQAVVWQLKDLGVDAPAGIVDAAFESVRAPGSGRAGQASSFTADPEPIAEPQNTAELLTELVDVFERHVKLPCRAAAIAIALWILHTWAFDAADFSPRLIVRSPAKRCGKTLVLDILTLLCRRAIVASNTTAASIFRAVDKHSPTVLIDEADSQADLSNMLNAGYSRATGFVSRAERDGGGGFEPTQFKCFAPTVIAAIGRLSDTVEDRGVAIRMERKPRDLKLARLRREERRALEPLRPRLARWAQDATEELKTAKPPLPEALNDRMADVWEPLFAIADIAGDLWSKLARNAATELAGREEDDLGLHERLLADVRSVFCPPPSEPGSAAPAQHRFLAIKRIVDALIQDELLGWDEAFSGRALTASRFTRIMGGKGGFGIAHRRQPREETNDGKPGPRGYLHDDLEPVWAKYLPELRNGGTGQQTEGKSNASGGGTPPNRSAVGSARKPNNHVAGSAVPPREPSTKARVRA